MLSRLAPDLALVLDHIFCANVAALPKVAEFFFDGDGVCVVGQGTLPSSSRLSVYGNGLESGGVITGIESSDEISDAIETLRRDNAPLEVVELRELVANLLKPVRYLAGEDFGGGVGGISLSGVDGVVRTFGGPRESGLGFCTSSSGSPAEWMVGKDESLGGG